MFSFQKPQIDDDFANWLKETVNIRLANMRVKFEQDEIALCEYALGDKPNSHELQYVDLKEHLRLQEIVHTFRSLHNCDLFSRENHAFLEKLRFYTIVVESEIGGTLLFFRTSSKMYAAKSPKKCVFLDDRHGLTLADPPLFVFDEVLDCVCVGDDIFVFTGRNDQFHQMFLFYEEAVKLAHSNADQLAARVPINNFELFKKSCGSFDVANRLNAIVADGHLEGLDIEKIAEFIANEDIGVRVIEIDGEKKLDFEPKLKWAFINLLQDSNVESILTKRKYLAQFKRLRQPKGDATQRPRDSVATRTITRNARPRRTSPNPSLTNQ